MRGQVLGVDVRTGEGLVAGDDGQRYRFSQADWAHRGEPAIGVTVDFEAQEGRALSVFPMPGSLPVATALAAPAESRRRSDRNPYVAALLAFFFGVFGLHRFYLGRNGSAIVMLILTITVVGMVISAPWALIDAVRYLVMPEDEFAARYDRRR